MMSQQTRTFAPNVENKEKISKFISIKKSTGRSFNAEVQNRKEYRNPDFLLHAVTYQDIDQIEADTRLELERREQERKKNQKLEFTPGGIQPGNVIPAPKINIPTPGLTAVAGGVLNVTSAASDVTARDVRQNKKSKWDKVDVDQESSLPTGGQESLTAIGAHAALISAAKAGSRYSACAQHRRKEAEDKRSSDRKSDRK